MWLQNCWVPAGPLTMVSPLAGFGEKRPSFSFGIAKYFLSGDEVVGTRRVQTTRREQTTRRVQTTEDSANNSGQYKQPISGPSASPCSVAQAMLPRDIHPKLSGIQGRDSATECSW